MRTRAAAQVVAAAAVLGALTGVVAHNRQLTAAGHPGRDGDPLAMPSTESPSPRPGGSASPAARSAGTLSAAASSTGATAAPRPSRSPTATPTFVGTANLIQREDFRDVGVRFDRLDTEKTVLNGEQPVSRCSGRKQLSEIAGPGVEPVAATWTSQTVRTHVLTETIARGATDAEASRLVSTLVDAGIRPCRPPRERWSFGPVTTSTIGSGSATWAVSYDDGGVETGAVAVVRNGLNLGIVEITDPLAEAGPTIRDLATAAVRRLA